MSIYLVIDDEQTPMPLSVSCVGDDRVVGYLTPAAERGCGLNMAILRERYISRTESYWGFGYVADMVEYVLSDCATGKGKPVFTGATMEESIRKAIAAGRRVIAADSVPELMFALVHQLDGVEVLVRDC